MSVFALGLFSFYMLYFYSRLLLTTQRQKEETKKKKKGISTSLSALPACVPNGGFGGRLDHWLPLLWRPRPSPLAGHEQSREASVLCFGSLAGVQGEYQVKIQKKIFSRMSPQNWKTVTALHSTENASIIHFIRKYLKA